MRVRTFLQTTACVLFATWLCAAPVTAKGARAPKVRVRPRLAVDLSGAVSSGTVVLPFALEGAGKPSSLRLHWRHLGETAWTDLVVGTGRAWLASIEARGSVEFWAEAAVGAQAVTFGSAEKPVLLVLTPTDSVAPVLSLRNTERLPGSTASSSTSTTTRASNGSGSGGGHSVPKAGASSLFRAVRMGFASRPCRLAATSSSGRLPGTSTAMARAGWVRPSVPSSFPSMFSGPRRR